MTPDTNQYLETLFDNIEMYYQQELQTYNTKFDAVLNQLNLTQKKFSNRFEAYNFYIITI